MDSYQEYNKVKKRITELQNWPDLDIVEQMELDRLIKEINTFNEKMTNFE